MNHVLHRRLISAVTLFVSCTPGSALAGPPVKLNGPLVAGGNVSEHVSIFSPDGSRVFYVADQDTLGVPELFSVPSGGGAPVKLNIPLASGVAADFFVNPDSEHVYYRDLKTTNSAGIFAVPSIGGASVNLSGQLEMIYTMGNPCDGYLFAPDQCTFMAEQYPQGMLLSPDGSLLIYTATNIYSVSTMGGTPTILVSGGTDQAAITADGSRFVYQKWDGNGRQVHSVPIGGGLSVQLSTGSGITGSTLSSDGSSIVYEATLGSPGTWAIYSVPTAGGTSVKLNAPYVPGGTYYYRDFQMQFSADGNRVVYRVDQDTLGRYELYSVPSTGGTPVKLNGPLKSGSISGTGFTPDGSRVAYTGAQDNAGVTDLYIVPIAGGANLKLNSPLGIGGSVDTVLFTPNSKYVVYRAMQQSGEPTEIWSVLSTGGTPVKLNGSLVAGGNVVGGNFRGSFGFNPDGSRFVYAADQEINEFFELYIVPTTGGAPVKLSAGLEVYHFNTEFSPDGSRVLFETMKRTNSPREIYSRVVRQHWNTGDGNWDTAANWNYGELPDEVMQVTIAGPAAVVASGNATTRSVNELRLGGGTGTSSLTLASQAAITAINGITLESNGVLGGNGSIVGKLSNYGLVSPGASTGTLIVDGDYSQSAGGLLQIELASAASIDKLLVTGSANLAGKLTVKFTNGFVPTAGQTFDLLDWGTLAGTFDTLMLPTLNGRLTWNTTQLYTSGVLSVNSGLRGDFNASGAVDAADLAQWQGDFGVNALSDADADGDSDGDDFLTWQRQLGSSLISSSKTIPEPATMLLFIVAAAGLRHMGGRIRQELINA